MAIGKGDGVNLLRPGRSDEVCAEIILRLDLANSFGDMTKRVYKRRTVLLEFDDKIHQLGSSATIGNSDVKDEKHRGRSRC